MNAALPGPVYLDSNVLILGLEAPDGQGSVARSLLRECVSGERIGVVGDAVIAEVMVGVLRTGSSELASEMSAFLTSGLLTVVGHDRDMFLDAARIRARAGGHLIDALHVATAIAAGCDAVISQDSRMPRIPGMPVVRVDEIALTG